MTIKSRQSWHQTNTRHSSDAEEDLYRRYSVSKTLGRGRFAVVKSAKHLISGEKVAVKIIDKTKLDNNSAERLYNEVEHLKIAKHDSIVKLYEFIDTKKNLYLILERADRGDLYDFIMDNSTIVDAIPMHHPIDVLENDSQENVLDQATNQPPNCPPPNQTPSHRVHAGIGEYLARRFFRQITEALYICHNHNIVHRDLKPENVVIFTEKEEMGSLSSGASSTGQRSRCLSRQDGTGVLGPTSINAMNVNNNTNHTISLQNLRAKITDFGFSNKFNPENQLLATSCGSLAYSAPEILLGEEYNAPAVDVWSLGVLLYMLVCGSVPFNEANDSETLTLIMDCQYVIPAYVSPACCHLIRNMITLEAAERFTVKQILNHEWMQMDEEALKQYDSFLDKSIPVSTSIMYSNNCHSSMSMMTDVVPNPMNIKGRPRSNSLTAQVSKDEVKQVYEKCIKAGIQCTIDSVSDVLITENGNLSEFSATCNLLLVSVRRSNRRKAFQNRPQSVDSLVKDNNNNNISETNTNKPPSIHRGELRSPSPLYVNSNEKEGAEKDGLPAEKSLRMSNGNISNSNLNFDIDNNNSNRSDQNLSNRYNQHSQRENSETRRDKLSSIIPSSLRPSTSIGSGFSKSRSPSYQNIASVISQQLRKIPNIGMTEKIGGLMVHNHDNNENENDNTFTNDSSDQMRDDSDNNQSNNKNYNHNNNNDTSNNNNNEETNNNHQKKLKVISTSNSLTDNHKILKKSRSSSMSSLDSSVSSDFSLNSQTVNNIVSENSQNQSFANQKRNTSSSSTPNININQNNHNHNNNPSSNSNLSSHVSHHHSISLHHGNVPAKDENVIDSSQGTPILHHRFPSNPLVNAAASKNHSSRNSGIIGENINHHQVIAPTFSGNCSNHSDNSCDNLNDENIDVTAGGNANRRETSNASRSSLRDQVRERSSQSASKRRLSGQHQVPQRESMTITPRKALSENVKSILIKTSSSNNSIFGGC